MAIASGEKRAFLKQKVPPAYEAVRPLVEEFKTTLEQPLHEVPSADRIASKRCLVGLEEPTPASDVADLHRILRKAGEAANLDPDNAAAWFLLARAICELGRFDETTCHPVPVRDALDFAERSRSLAPTVGKAWAAVIECYLYLGHNEIVTEMLAELHRLGRAPGTHNVLSARFARSQGRLEDAVADYQRAIDYIAQPHRRADAFGQQAMVYLEMGEHEKAARSFMFALLEGGPIAWIAHNFSVLKLEMQDIAEAAELNSRVLLFDPGFQPAIDFHRYLEDRFKQAHEPYPLPAPLAVEIKRGIALPGCDESVIERTRLEPWSRPKPGSRARATRTFRNAFADD